MRANEKSPSEKSSNDVSSETNGDREEHCYLNSAVGWLRIAADQEGLRSIQLINDPPKVTQPPNLPHLKEAYKQLSEYFRGERMTFSLTLRPNGTPFQRSVWSTLADVPFGTTVSYKQLAERLGRPSAERDIGMANQDNPLPIVVPSHRLVGDEVQIGPGALGPEARRQLLRIEGTEQ